jgi:hypothetical protein
MADKEAVDNRFVALDAAMATGQIAYPVEIGATYYVTTPRYDCRGTVCDYGPLGFMLQNCERVFETGTLTNFLEGGPAQTAAEMGNRHFVNWMAAMEITQVAPRNSIKEG